MKGCYSYRGEIIFKNEKTDNKWVVAANGNYDDFDTLDEAKNAIDKHLGGYSGLGRYAGTHFPKRWMKDEKLKVWYWEGYK